MPSEASEEIDLEALRKEKAALAAQQFDKRAAEVREYYNTFFGQQVREGLQTLASERPADPKGALSKIFLGKKSHGEVGKEPKTVDPALKSAAPRQYLNATIAPALVPAMAQCFREQPRRPISELGEHLSKT
mmetsp:Transcript_105710/g.264676  ORF Transcript_105710/g.264676 Transcript_105710/m.264676 type:complete len:132 (+) Transcript_105710:93-488(+)